MLEGMKKRLKANKALRAFRNYLFVRRLKYTDVILGTVAAALLLFCWLFSMPLSQVFTSTMDITLGYSAKQDESGLYYVVDDGHSRLICFDADARIRYALVNPTDGDDDGLYIEDFAVDNGLVYLSASCWDGMLLSKEVIAVFNGERYVRTIAERNYSGMAVNNIAFTALRFRTAYCLMSNARTTRWFRIG